MGADDQHDDDDDDEFFINKSRSFLLALLSRQRLTDFGQCVRLSGRGEQTAALEAINLGPAACLSRPQAAANYLRPRLGQSPSQIQHLMQSQSELLLLLSIGRQRKRTANGGRRKWKFASGRITTSRARPAHDPNRLSIKTHKHAARLCRGNGARDRPM